MNTKFKTAVDEFFKFVGERDEYEKLLKAAAAEGYRKNKKCYLCGKKRKVSHPWAVVRNTEAGPQIEFHTIQTCLKHSDPLKLVELKRSISANGVQRGMGFFVTATAPGSDKFRVETGPIGSDA
jgi:hypothetical protein